MQCKNTNNNYDFRVCKCFVCLKCNVSFMCITMPLEWGVW